MDESRVANIIVVKVINGDNSFSYVKGWEDDRYSSGA
jgi:hypothetical protein